MDELEPEEERARYIETWGFDPLKKQVLEQLTDEWILEHSEILHRVFNVGDLFKNESFLASIDNTTRRKLLKLLLKINKDETEIIDWEGGGFLSKLREGDFLMKLLQTIYKSWESKDPFNWDEVPFLLIRHFLNNKNNIEEFLINLFLANCIEWLEYNWLDFEEQFALTGRIVSESGQVNDAYKKVEKQILTLMGEVYKGAFSQSLLRDDVKVTFDDTVGDPESPEKMWHYESVFSLDRPDGGGSTYPRIVVTLDTFEDDEKDGRIYYQENASKTGDGLVILRDFLLWDTLKMGLPVGKYFSFLQAYGRLLVMCGGKTIAGAARLFQSDQGKLYQEQKSKRGFRDAFYRCLRDVAPDQAQNFTQNLALELTKISKEKNLGEKLLDWIFGINKEASQ